MMRWTGWRSKDGPVSDTAYTYNARGLQLSALFVGSGQGVTNTYDGFGRLGSSTTTMGGTSRTLSYQYDADGNRTRLTHPDGNFVNYYRDGLGRIYYTDVNSGLPVFYPIYDAQARVSFLYRYNAGAANWVQNTGYSYDGISRLSIYGHAFISSGYNVTTTVSYNPASQITAQTRDNDAYAWNGHYNVNRVTRSTASTNIPAPALPRSPTMPTAI